MRLTSQPSVSKRAQARWNVAGATSSLGDGYRRRKRKDCWLSWNEGYQLTDEPNSSSNIAIISSHSSTVIMINSIHSLLGEGTIPTFFRSYSWAVFHPANRLSHHTCSDECSQRPALQIPSPELSFSQRSAEYWY